MLKDEIKKNIKLKNDKKLPESTQVNMSNR
jgi:hypothetical protein